MITALAALENIVPPVPADTAVALGAFLAGRGLLNPWAVFGVTWAANVGSGSAVYWLARRYGRDFFTGPAGRRLLPPAVLAHIEGLYRRYGAFGIFISRLLPVWRAVVPPFAGLADVPVTRAVLPLAAAAALWYGTLTLAVTTLGKNLDAVVTALSRVNLVLGLLALGAVILVAVGTVRRLKR